VAERTPERAPQRWQPVGNLLIDALPAAQRGQLVGMSRQVLLAAGRVINEANQPIEAVYFPLGGLISLVAVTVARAGVNTASVGREGMVGLPVFLGVQSSPNVRAVVQVSGPALVLPAEDFAALARTPGSLNDLMRRYTNALMTQTSQEVACNRRHSVLERASCWLLLAHHRVGRSEFPLTQEVFSELLGTRRASITEAARTLQDAGAIQYHRGRVRVADPQTLERFSCECYRIIRSALDPPGTLPLGD